MEITRSKTEEWMRTAAATMAEPGASEACIKNRAVGVRTLTKAVVAQRG